MRFRGRTLLPRASLTSDGQLVVAEETGARTIHRAPSALLKDIVRRNQIDFSKGNGWECVFYQGVSLAAIRRGAA